jgi:hypothetical protein
VVRATASGARLIRRTRLVGNCVHPPFKWGAPIIPQTKSANGTYAFVRRLPDTNESRSLPAFPRLITTGPPPLRERLVRL